MGKRYVDEAGAEVLVTKAGAGTLSIGATALESQGSQAAAGQRLAFLAAAARPLCGEVEDARAGSAVTAESTTRSAPARR